MRYNHCDLREQDVAGEHSKCNYKTGSRMKEMWPEHLRNNTDIYYKNVCYNIIIINNNNSNKLTCFTD